MLEYMRIWLALRSDNRGVTAMECGVTAMEYGLIASLIAVVIIIAVTQVGTKLTATFNAIAAALRGPLYFRRWFSREPIDDSFVDLIVQGVLAGVRRDHPKRSGQGGRRRPT